MILTNCKIYLDGGFKEDHWIEIRSGIITGLGVMNESVSGDDCKGKIVIPGFIDQHMHGAAGFDVMDGDENAIRRIAEYLPSEGVTSFLGTTITQSERNIIHALGVMGDYDSSSGAELLGIHLEGPFISKEVAGAHLKQYIQKPEIEAFKTYDSASNNRIKVVTLACEEDENNDLIKYLSSKSIVASLGHSRASFEEVKQAIIDGACCVTHCYNAMGKFSHREVGLIGAALLNDDLYSEVICDGYHVNKESIKIFDKLKVKERKILITDGMRAKGLSSGEYELGGQMVKSDTYSVRLKDGKLAGSLLRADTAVKNYMEFTDTKLEDVLFMITENPAKLLGVFDRKGSIDIGKDADIVLLNEDLSIHKTFCRGIESYKENI